MISKFHHKNRTLDAEFWWCGDKINKGISNPDFDTYIGIPFFVWALAVFSVLFDDLDESLPIFIELSYADPGQFPDAKSVLGISSPMAYGVLS